LVRKICPPRETGILCSRRPRMARHKRQPLHTPSSLKEGKSRKKELQMPRQTLRAECPQALPQCWPGEVKWKDAGSKIPTV